VGLVVGVGPVVDLVVELQVAVPVLLHLQPSHHSPPKPSFTVQEELEALSGGKARVVKLSKPLDPPSRPGLSSAPSRSIRFPAVPLVVRAAKAAVVAEALVEMHR
jgi:hypothetical protein